MLNNSKKFLSVVLVGEVEELRFELSVYVSDYFLKAITADASCNHNELIQLDAFSLQVAY